MNRAEIGMCFDRSFSAGEVTSYARQLETHGIDQMWVIEDCFFTAGVSLAAAALAVSHELKVGIGVLPAVARNVAITAMEIATLANIAPGRLTAGIGHGVQDWMGQMGARTSSPLTTLEEVIVNVKRLLAGERVTFDGRHVHLADVALDQPPLSPPSVLAGVQRERGVALAGSVADGVILVEGTGPAYVEWVLERTGRRVGFEVATFTLLSVHDDRGAAYAEVAGFVAGLVRERRPALAVLPFFDEMLAKVNSVGEKALIDMPVDYWTEIGAIGTWDDAIGHVAALEASGVGSINIFPGPDLSGARDLMSLVARLATR